ncbi:hypothetical protein BV25DRAFT_129691 [Artomyces pyxidatus]|uniref:Uncharacterized protein n=1 Tax=Artomyces pyxidatus TaxID=48021 RepID=A0ACB8TAK6_9AGAM|nr:hypothetical protein BV25DRAFT_129691 [Artomyces pyxidatus]
MGTYCVSRECHAAVRTRWMCGIPSQSWTQHLLWFRLASLSPPHKRCRLSIGAAGLSFSHRPPPVTPHKQRVRPGEATRHHRSLSDTPRNDSSSARQDIKRFQNRSYERLASLRNRSALRRRYTVVDGQPPSRESRT